MKKCVVNIIRDATGKVIDRKVEEIDKTEEDLSNESQIEEDRKKFEQDDWMRKRRESYRNNDYIDSIMKYLDETVSNPPDHLSEAIQHWKKVKTDNPKPLGK